MISGSLLEEIVDFVECWVHSILYARKIYPAVLFEQKRYQEISVWQSRHPDINAYIRRVIDNLRPLIEQGAVDRIIFNTMSSTGQSIDHIIIKCSLFSSTNGASSSSNSNGGNGCDSEADMLILREELRSAILRLCLLDAQLPRLPEDCTWGLMAITGTNDSSGGVRSVESDGAIQAALGSGEWYVDTNQSTEQQSLARRTTAGAATADGEGGAGSGGGGSNGTGGGSGAGGSGTGPRLVPVKSFRNDLVDLSVYVHVF